MIAPNEPLSHGMREGLRPPVLAGILSGVLVLLLFFGGFAVWAGLAPLQSAAIATGLVKLDTNRRTIQHLEGGIIKKIAVREGERVKRGQMLLTMDTTRYAAQIVLLKAQIQSVNRQLDLLAQEIADVQKLFDKGLALKPRILALRRRQAELQGEKTKHRSAMSVAQDNIDRAVVRTPIAGTVVSLRVHTAGGVIKPGDTLMSIVPANDLLVIEAQIDPNDIDVVRAGLPANVRLTPYGAREIPPITGSVQWVSADRLSDQRSGAAYYLARITLDKKALQLGDGVRLYPGMPAEVMIVTGKQTMLGYFVEPLIRSFRRAFREQ